jgi:DNA-binding GntR family transcriptional regulator
MVQKRKAGAGKGASLHAINDRLDEELDLRERRDSLVGRIASEIARAISEGTLAPGADLNSVDLATRFGTSRTPVREALMLLEKEGLVEIPPRRRPRVAEISLDQVEELYQIRSVLNGLMIGLFVQNASADQMQGMVALHAQMKQCAETGDLDGYYETRRALHNYWSGTCGNASLGSLLSTWKMPGHASAGGRRAFAAGPRPACHRLPGEGLGSRRRADEIDDGVWSCRH